MLNEKIIEEISRKDFDRKFFVEQILQDEGSRRYIVRLMLEHPHIMVYYHAYYVLFDASLIDPGLFYIYWEKFVSLLKHPNSYHRDFGLVLLSNLAGVDGQGRFDEIFEDYFACMNDPRFMTAQCCVGSTVNILRVKPHLAERIGTLFLGFEQFCDYPPKQKALLTADVLDVLEIIYSRGVHQQEVGEFILQAQESLSPKTRRKAKMFIRQLDLDQV